MTGRLHLVQKCDAIDAVADREAENKTDSIPLVKKPFELSNPLWLLLALALVRSALAAGPAAAISRFTPSSGPPGTSILIFGENLDGATSVKFSGIAAAFTGFGGNLTAIVPADAVTGPISVTAPAGTATSTDLFTVTKQASPVIASFSPLSGKAGTSVQIRGANLTGITSVQFNGVTGAFTVFSGIVFATVPATASTGPITVTTPAGSFTTASPFNVEQTSPPAVTGFSPSSGEPGTSVQVDGSNLVGVTAVKFNDVNAVFTFFGGSLLATVPTNAATGPITVVTPLGSSTTAETFTVTKRSGPVISGFSPASGEAGALVEISGTTLIGLSSVKFGGIEAQFVEFASERLLAYVPTNAVSGFITVTTKNGTATSSTAFSVTIAPPPVAPPSLSIRVSAPGQLEVSWTTNALDFVLQATSELVPSGTWTNLNLTATTVQDRRAITVPPSAQKMFFRLNRP